MYGRSFEDPDGHMWGVNWVDMAAVPSKPAKADA
jgi:predicted lactoylglutathione lyase